jgi:hypothetical protein
MITTIHASLSSNALDDLPPNHHITRLVVSAENTRFHHAGPQLTTSLHEKNLDPKDKKLDESNHHQCLTCHRFKAQATQRLRTSYYHLESNP